jgi:DNA-binding transcriptional ArsR family regulator
MKVRRSLKHPLTLAQWFDNCRIMEKINAIAALAALAQDNRLDVFRLLVRAGRKGMPAGAVATKLHLAPNTLSFHFDRLRQAGLISVKREGRSLIYAARYETMDHLLAYLTENCCAGVADCCAPQAADARKGTPPIKIAKPATRKAKVPA